VASPRQRRLVLDLWDHLPGSPESREDSRRDGSPGLAGPRGAVPRQRRGSCPSARCRLPFEQGDLSVGEFCRQMKTKADALRDLGHAVPEPTLVLNVLRGLNSSFDHLRTWITRQKPFPTFLQVWDDLVLEEITRGPVTASPTFASSTSKALVATPPTSASHSSSLLGPPPSGPSGGGGGKGEKGGRRRRGGRGGAWWDLQPWRCWWWWWPHQWRCRWWWWHQPWRCWWRTSGLGVYPCPWRYALAILRQPMVRAYLHVALPGSAGHHARWCSSVRACLDSPA
jgi:hypothetical protein